MVCQRPPYCGRPTEWACGGCEVPVCDNHLCDNPDPKKDALCERCAEEAPLPETKEEPCPPTR